MTSFGSSNQESLIQKFKIKPISPDMQLWLSGGGQSPYATVPITPMIPASSQFIVFNGIPPAAEQSPAPYMVSLLPGSSQTPSLQPGSSMATSNIGGDLKISYYKEDPPGTPAPVTVEAPTNLYFSFPDGYVTDNGNGEVTVTSPSGGAIGTLTAIAPLAGAGNMASNHNISINYDSVDSFQLGSGSELKLKAVAVSTPTVSGVVDSITADAFGRITAYTRQYMGICKINGSSRSAGNRYWTYSVIEQIGSMGASWPFFTTGAGSTLTAYNLLETANTGSSVYGLTATDASGTGNIPLDDYPDYEAGPAPTGLMVQVWKWGSIYFFSAPNVISGACP